MSVITLADMRLVKLLMADICLGRHRERLTGSTFRTLLF